MSKNYVLMVDDAMHGVINHLFGGKIQLLEIGGLVVPGQEGNYNIVVAPVQKPMPVIATATPEPSDPAIHDESPDQPEVNASQQPVLSNDCILGG